MTRGEPKRVEPWAVVDMKTDEVKSRHLTWADALAERPPLHDIQYRPVR